MRRRHVLALGVLVAAIFSLGSGQTRMRLGEVTIFLTNGDSVIDGFKAISRVREFVATEGGGEYPLSEIWMMNFINDAWDFPAERKQIREGRHYLFLRNDDVVSGRLIDFDRDKQTFILQSGSVVPIGQVRRIYLSPHVPAALSGGQGAGQETSSSPWVGTFYRDVPSPPMEIELFGDGTARLTIETARGRTNVLKGRWTDIDGQTVRVNVQSETISSDRRSIVFGLERDTLISLSGSFGANVRLQRR